MIKSDIVKINKISNFDDIYIEKELSKKYSEIIRWAVVEVNETDIVLSVSCNKP